MDQRSQGSSSFAASRPATAKRKSEPSFNDPPTKRPRSSLGNGFASHDTDIIVISDSDDEPPPPSRHAKKPSSRAPVSRIQIASADSDSEVQIAPQRLTLKPRKPRSQKSSTSRARFVEDANGDFVLVETPPPDVREIINVDDSDEDVVPSPPVRTGKGKQRETDAKGQPAVKAEKPESSSSRPSQLSEASSSTKPRSSQPTPTLNAGLRALSIAAPTTKVHTKSSHATAASLGSASIPRTPPSALPSLQVSKPISKNKDASPNRNTQTQPQTPVSHPPSQKQRSGQQLSGRMLAMQAFKPMSFLDLEHISIPKKHRFVSRFPDSISAPPVASTSSPPKKPHSRQGAPSDVAYDKDVSDDRPEDPTDVFNRAMQVNASLGSGSGSSVRQAVQRLDLRRDKGTHAKVDSKAKRLDPDPDVSMHSAGQSMASSDDEALVSPPPRKPWKGKAKAAPSYWDLSPSDGDPDGFGDDSPSPVEQREPIAGPQDSRPSSSHIVEKTLSNEFAELSTPAAGPIGWMNPQREEEPLFLPGSPIEPSSDGDFPSEPESLVDDVITSGRTMALRRSFVLSQGVSGVEYDDKERPSDLCSRPGTPDWQPPQRLHERPHHVDDNLSYDWEDQRRMMRMVPPAHKRMEDLSSRMLDHVATYSPFLKQHEKMQTLHLAEMLVNAGEEEVEFVNKFDAEAAPPFEFYYTNQLVPSGPDVPSPSRKDLTCCDCLIPCKDNPKCACKLNQQRKFKEHVKLQSELAGDNKEEAKHWKETKYPKGTGFLYDADGTLGVFLAVYECNDLCRCNIDCVNRKSQRPRGFKLSVFKTTNGRGWGVRYDGKTPIPAGTFIGVYAGEVLTDQEAENRGYTYDRANRTYLYDLDAGHLRIHWEEENGRTYDEEKDNYQKYVIDAHHVGNFTRFFNHSCKPNLVTVPLYVNNDNPFMFERAFFTWAEVTMPGEELTFDYAPAITGNEPGIAGNSGKFALCKCGAPGCKGRMFS